MCTPGKQKPTPYEMHRIETDRMTTSADVPDRTLFEVYYPPFRGAVEAGVGSIMCSYNLVNGHHACNDKNVLARDLKERMGFEGWVLTDWFATMNIASAIHCQ